MPSFTDNLGNESRLEMVSLPGGEFTMGSNEYDEMPPHQVKVDPFAISRYEITQAQWKAVMGDNPSSFKSDDNHPVEQVSWNQAQEFINRLRDKTRNQTYRLPTEAEWEYAARAGSKSRYSFGDDESRLSDYAWFAGNSGSQTHHFGQKLPNAWGLFDMHGNVVEWCQDWFDENYYNLSPRENPQGPLSGKGRVQRGGSWSLSAIDCRSTGRGHDPPGDHYHDVGFRVVCVVKAP
jgi:eukaryotic-like serine/threonine-protein kinase